MKGGYEMEYKKIIFVSLLFSLISLMCIFALAQGVGYIQIKCEPGATVFLDSKFMGNTSLELGGLILQDVPAGTHEVRIVKEGFKPQSVKIDLKVNEIYLYEVSLKQKIGALLVETIPIDCIIEIPLLNIDKEHEGNKTEKAWEVSSIPIGSYKINFLALGKKVKYDLEIEEGTRKHLLVNILNNEVKELLPILTWDRTYGGSGYEEANSLIQTTDGGYAVAGWTQSKGAGEEDFWVIKLDEQGKMVWDRTYGGNGYDEAYSLIQTTDSGYAVAGPTNISRGAGGTDFWVIKLDEQGNLISGVEDPEAVVEIKGADKNLDIPDYEAQTETEKTIPNIQSLQYPIFDSYQWEVGIPGFFEPGEITKFKDTTISTESSPQISETAYFLTGSLHCPETRGYPCDSCSSALGYDNHFQGFNVLTTNGDCYVKLTYNDGDYIGNQNSEVTIKGEKWLGLEEESGTELVEEINSECFNFEPANKFVERTMNFPDDNYKYEFANEGKEIRLYLSRNREEAFKAVPWQNIIIEIKNKETDKVFTYKFEKGIFPLAYAWSNGVANYGQCVWWAAKRWVEEMDPKTLFPFYPPAPEAVNVKKIDSNYQPKKFDILIDYDPRQASELGHYGFVEKVDDNSVYITQFNFIPPGEVYNHILRTWKGNATNLFYSNNFLDEYYFRYYYRK